MEDETAGLSHDPTCKLKAANDAFAQALFRYWRSLYDETGDVYYCIRALRNALAYDVPVPQWAADPILIGLAAWERGEKSLDRALGLQGKGRKADARKRAQERLRDYALTLVTWGFVHVLGMNLHESCALMSDWIEKTGGITEHSPCGPISQERIYAIVSGNDPFDCEETPDKFPDEYKREMIRKYRRAWPESQQWPEHLRHLIA